MGLLRHAYKTYRNFEKVFIKTMKIYLGTDHAGFDLKEKIKSYLLGLGYEAEDKGNFVFEQNDDYPDFMFPVSEAVVQDPDSVGVILGGSGEGEAIAANKVKGARAIVFYHYDEEIIRLSREHNNANILCLGARFLSEEEAKKAVLLWLKTPFTGEERHARRIAKIDKYNA